MYAQLDSLEKQICYYEQSQFIIERFVTQSIDMEVAMYQSFVNLYQQQRRILLKLREVRHGLVEYYQITSS